VPVRSSAALVFWLLTLGYFLSYFFRSTNAVIAEDLTRELRLSSADLGLMTSVFYLSFAGSQLPMGWAFDRFGVRFVQPVLLLIAVLGALTFSFASSLATATLARALLGVGLTGALMAAFKGFGAWFPPQRQATMTGYLMALGTLGALGASTPLAWLSSLTGWRSVFVYGAGLTFVAALAILLFVRDAPHGQARASALEVSGGDVGTRMNFFDSRLWRVAFVNVFAAGALLSIQTLWGGKFLFDVYNLEKPQVGELLTVLNLGVFVGYALIGWLSDRFGLTRVVVLGLFAFVVCLVALATRVPLGWLPMVYFAFGVFGTSNLLLLTHARRLFAVALTGRATTFVNMFGIGGTFALQTLIGVVVSALRLEGYTWAFGGLAAALLVALAVYLRVVDTLEIPRIAAESKAG
jgi:sugar phosphate permease